MIKPDRTDSAPARRMIGANGSYDMQTRGEIPALWAGWNYKAVQGVIGDMVFGISHRFRPNGFDYMCAFQVSDDAPIPKGQQALLVPASDYVVFSHDGHVSGIGGVFDAVHPGAQLPDGWSFEPGPQLEVYGEDFNGETGTGRVEIWFPAKCA